jgi:hypothetical protein
MEPTSGRTGERGLRCAAIEHSGHGPLPDAEGAAWLERFALDGIGLVEHDLVDFVSEAEPLGVP